MPCRRRSTIVVALYVRAYTRSNNTAVNNALTYLRVELVELFFLLFFFVFLNLLLLAFLAHGRILSIRSIDNRLVASRNGKKIRLSRSIEHRKKNMKKVRLKLRDKVSYENVKCWSILKKQAAEFCRETGLHGYKYISQTQRSKAERYVCESFCIRNYCERDKQLLNTVR